MATDHVRPSECAPANLIVQDEAREPSGLGGLHVHRRWVSRSSRRKVRNEVGRDPHGESRGGPVAIDEKKTISDRGSFGDLVGSGGPTAIEGRESGCVAERRPRLLDVVVQISDKPPESRVELDAEGEQQCVEFGSFEPKGP